MSYMCLCLYPCFQYKSINVSNLIGSVMYYMEKEINSLMPGFTFSVLHALPHSVYSHSSVDSNIEKKKKSRSW